jgi:putative MATE family efflux protein
MSHSTPTTAQPSTAQFTDERTRALAEKPVGRLLWQFALPSIIAMSASSIYNLCDSIFIGHGVGPMAIAGLAITFPLMNIMQAFGAMMGVGAGALTSVRLGENNRHASYMILGNMLRMDVTIGLILMTIGLLFLDPILRLFGASEVTLPYAREYMQIILVGNIITHPFLGMNDQLRASGYPRKAMAAQLIAVVANIIMDYVFIFQFGWGMRGAAIATVGGQLLALLYEVHHFSNKRNLVHFSREGLVLNWKIIKGILAVGLSPFCLNICGCIVVIFLNRALLEQGGAEGDNYVGAYGIVNRVGMLMVQMVIGFSQGLQPIVGFNLGAKLYARVRGVLFVAFACAICVMTVGYTLVCIFPRQLTMLFTTDQRLIEICEPALRIVFCIFPLVGGQMITVSFFQAIRKAWKAIFLSMTRQMIFLLPLLLILPPIMGPTGVWWSMPIADAISSVMSVFLLLPELKKFKRLAASTQA